ncbi:MAG: hypothetical protein H0U29_11225, partial [Acidimicrobiia bacterium]|nr:hypothetical protein [Acidimicrobiia bacterium]
GSRDPDSGPAAFAPDVAATLSDATLLRYAHLSHFGPFQDPDTIAEDIMASFAGFGER